MPLGILTFLLTFLEFVCICKFKSIQICLKTRRVFWGEWVLVSEFYVLFNWNSIISAWYLPFLNTEMLCELSCEACLQQSCKKLWKEVRSLCRCVKNTRLGHKTMNAVNHRMGQPARLDWGKMSQSYWWWFVRLPCELASEINLF